MPTTYLLDGQARCPADEPGSAALEPALRLVGYRRGLESLQALEKIGCGMPAVPGVQQECGTGPDQDSDRNDERGNQYTCQDDQQCHAATVVWPAGRPDRFTRLIQLR
jgi:hypothetical protein